MRHWCNDCQDGKDHKIIKITNNGTFYICECGKETKICELKKTIRKTTIIIDEG